MLFVYIFKMFEQVTIGVKIGKNIVAYKHELVMGQG